jgi:membrane protease YdiL (CAAX protease family)
MKGIKNDDVAPEEKPAWSIQAGLIISLVAIVATQWVAGIFLYLYPVLFSWDAARAEAWLAQPFMTFLSILLFESMAIALIAWFATRKRVSFREATALGRIRWRDPGYAMAGFLVYIVLAIVVFAILPLFFQIDTDQEQAIGFEPGTGGLALLLAFVGLVILPPITEEIVFRGFLYGTLRSNKLSFVWATLVTSLVFGGLHLFSGASGGLLWVGFVDTFVLSLILCYVREQTGSLWASIMVHALKNGLVFLNLFVISAA